MIQMVVEHFVLKSIFEKKYNAINRDNASMSSRYNVKNIIA